MMGRRIARNSGYDKTVFSAGGVGMANELKVTPRSVRHAPDGAVAVFGNQKRAVMRHGDADGPPLHLGIVDHKSGHETTDDQERRHQPLADFGAGSGFHGVHDGLTALDARFTTAPST
jgi:hypothetical protein